MSTATTPSDNIVSKSEFAQLVNVSKGRVSQYISEGKISSDALDGEGRSARIIVDKALADLEDALDVSQRFGNGLESSLARDDAVSPTETGRKSGTIADQLAADKLTKSRIETNRMIEQEQLRRGTYMLTSEAKRAVDEVARNMIRTFEGGLVDVANSISAEFKLPHRDVIHLLKAEFRKLRQSVADRRAQELAATEPVAEYNGTLQGLVSPDEGGSA